MTERGKPEPFFVAPGAAPGARLLLISYHFPPGTAVGGLRWQKFAAFAAERGWGLDVIAADPAQLPARDERRLAELPPGTRVYGVARPRLLRHRVEDWLRRRLRRGLTEAAGEAGHAAGVPALPGSFARAELRWWPRSVRDLVRARDAIRGYGSDGRWAGAAARVGIELAREQRFLACVTSGPPHMAHVAGQQLRHVLGLPHVMDMRDPWSRVERVVEHVGSPVWYVLAQRRERQAVASASLVVMNTGLAAAAMRATYPAAAGRIVAVPNGFDDERIPLVPRGRTFVIAYAGSIYLDRDPRPLLEAAARVIEERRLTPDDLRLDFMGVVEGRPVEEVAAEEGIAAYVRWRPPAPRGAAMEFQAAASMLVCLYQDSRQAIPAKLYEYMLFDAWLLVFADPGSGTADLLAGTDADVRRPGDLDGIAAVISRRYAEHVAGTRPQRLARDARFSRRTQATILFDAIERVTGPVSPGGGARSTA
jgi:hypothetical protein